MTNSTSDAPPKSNGSLNKKWILWGAAGLAIVVAVVVTLVIVLRPDSSVKADQLDALLLDAGQINTIMGAQNMQASKPMPEPAQPASTLSNPDCLGALTAAQAPTYASSGFTALHWNAVKEPGAVEHYVAQAVAVFPDAAKANAFVQNSAAQWESCAGQAVTTSSGDSHITWTIGTPSGTPPNITLSESREDVKGWTSQRALRAESNVVIDISASGYHITDQGSQIAEKIAANVSDKK